MVPESFIDDYIAGSPIGVVQKRDVYLGCRVLLFPPYSTTIHGLSQFRACHNTVCFGLEIYPAIHWLLSCDILLNFHLTDHYFCSSSLFSVIGMCRFQN